ncbi:hypothetical protein EII29_11185 [Leptotrichia sp. OH3620_COT-345]|nr:hypothetical protein EII29_11185 [Leptotrichia sp. OH3620_COT-345]
MKRKDGPSAISEEKYREGVEETIKNISKRPINKKVQFGEATLLIPENTIINSKQRNIVDMKTGYGIPIIFSETERCSNVFYCKQIKKEQYYKILYDEKDFEISKISEKIIKANGFTKTCN